MEAQDLHRCVHDLDVSNGSGASSHRRTDATRPLSEAHVLSRSVGQVFEQATRFLGGGHLFPARSSPHPKNA